MKPEIVDKNKIIEAIEKLSSSSFSILDFMETFKKLFPDEWTRLVERFGLFGEKKRYTVATYLANRLYNYSHKPGSFLKPFRRYEKGGKGDYRRATKEEGLSFERILKKEKGNTSFKGLSCLKDCLTKGERVVNL